MHSADDWDIEAQNSTQVKMKCFIHFLHITAKQELRTFVSGSSSLNSEACSKIKHYYTHLCTRYTESKFSLTALSTKSQYTFENGSHSSVDYFMTMQTSD